ncbi:hypothetical protein [Mesorhizobium shangrilense]|uniref:Uncharacterized protein n=1 Tax=Mesorhizobium shangrilense TaxID=460060 RepID=A0ABV2DQY6_9HYPH
MSVVYRKIAAILSGFAGEHGLPNAIGVTELASADERCERVWLQADAWQDFPQRADRAQPGA